MQRSDGSSLRVCKQDGGELCRRDRRQLQALLHPIDRDEESGGDLLLGLALLAQRQECPELVEGTPRRITSSGMIMSDGTLMNGPSAWTSLLDRSTASGENLTLGTREEMVGVDAKRAPSSRGTVLFFPHVRFGLHGSSHVGTDPPQSLAFRSFRVHWALGRLSRLLR